MRLLRCDDTSAMTLQWFGRSRWALKPPQQMRALTGEQRDDGDGTLLAPQPRAEGQERDGKFTVEIGRKFTTTFPHWPSLSHFSSVFHGLLHSPEVWTWRRQSTGACASCLQPTSICTWLTGDDVCAVFGRDRFFLAFEAQWTRAAAAAAVSTFSDDELPP